MLNAPTDQEVQREGQRYSTRFTVTFSAVLVVGIVAEIVARNLFHFRGVGFFMAPAWSYLLVGRIYLRRFMTIKGCQIERFVVNSSSWTRAQCSPRPKTKPSYPLIIATLVLTTLFVMAMNYLPVNENAKLFSFVMAGCTLAVSVILVSLGLSGVVGCTLDESGVTIGSGRFARTYPWSQVGSVYHIKDAVPVSTQFGHRLCFEINSTRSFIDSVNLSRMSEGRVQELLGTLSRYFMSGGSKWIDDKEFKNGFADYDIVRVYKRLYGDAEDASIDVYASE